MIFLICLIASWFEIGNGKKMLFSISFKYSYFKLVFNYIRKGLWKGTLIHQNCETLMCFGPCHTIAMFNDINNIASFECMFCKGCRLCCMVNQGHNPNQFAKRIGNGNNRWPIILRIRIQHEDLRGYNKSINQDVIHLILMNI